ncbi:2-isopropylmalate synthase [Clostridia bacterium]|nr:2-isopropylmalate synthase [Clostridia bacterium]
MNFKRYRPFPPIPIENREWCGRIITRPPVWCSVDLRDGNQSLEVPMTLSQKVEYFQMLTKIGFKEIEISFPAASDTEFAFTRKLIDESLIPDDVTIQVLTQCRPHIIEKTFSAVNGAKNVIIHFYNSTSTLQREVVFHKDTDGIKQIAVDAAVFCRELAEKYGRERFRFEYSPESFTGTELPFAVEICRAVIDALAPREGEKLIINLPSTVEMATPNVYADQIEYFVKNIERDAIVSLHAHNDRGCAVAATELGLMAGADRVEGTLFGNGERTGNADIMTLAMNMYSQGIDTSLNFSKLEEVAESYERLTRLLVHPRHPYAGKLVFAAFSGSHQDAINKGTQALREKAAAEGKDITEIPWEMPYLPIDPADIGKNYYPIIRINSQSGRGGIAYVLETYFGLKPPKDMQRHFSSIVTRVTDAESKELLPKEVHELFWAEYVNVSSPVSLISYSDATNTDSENTTVTCVFSYNGLQKTVEAAGSGLLDAFLHAVVELTGKRVEINDYHEHALNAGTKSKAITYVSVSDENGYVFFGAGTSSSISNSPLKAVLSAVNKSL